MNDEVKMIPIEQIRIVNPRHRDPKKFAAIVQSIKNVGLKMPIQVSRRLATETEEAGYDLICGQGRLEAFIALGHKEIPAIVVEISREELLLRSLVENIARRYPQPMDLIREIERLKALGYSHHQIGEKLDVSGNLVRGIDDSQECRRGAVAGSRLDRENSDMGRGGHRKNGHPRNAARTAQSIRKQATGLCVPQICEGADCAAPADWQTASLQGTGIKTQNQCREHGERISEREPTPEADDKKGESVRRQTVLHRDGLQQAAGR